MEYTCPVCGYSHLEDPAFDDEICPSCGTQFGYHDFNKSHAQLRIQWIKKRMPWHSKVDTMPVDWNPVTQLREANFLDAREILELQNIGHFRIGGTSKNSIAKIDFRQEFRTKTIQRGDITTISKWIAAGIYGESVGAIQSH